ncbi:transketolase, C-terminal domain-containing protein 1 [Nitratireductor indicus C115]|uniref:2-oxoglutarate dehydrogenase E1 component n=1 Tax=Nitratireductor indicus C115 TaxID=1231190 RepID=K2PBJ0_9HYPH|nr:transketolase, C-terminal domain-containing protein 1 [Nitratireductor indicus C115]
MNAFEKCPSATFEKIQQQDGTALQSKSLKKRSTGTPWWELQVSDADMRKVERTELVRMLEQLLLIREFEERLLDLSTAGILHGPAHASIGQEGAAVGAMSALGSTDKINGTHRMHHQFLAKALNHAAPKGYSPLETPFPEELVDVLFKTYSEILGLSTGYCGGRGGSMHLRLPEAGVLGSNAIVGGNLPHAVGYAFADKQLGRKDISVAFFGDGAMQNGATYEAMNLAALYRTPTVFFVENNLYAVSTHVSEQTREYRLAARGQGLGIPSIEFDGMDVIAARRAMELARQIIDDEGGPVLLEAKTYRYLHQSGALKGSAFGYRDKEEEEAWGLRDPATAFPAQLEKLGIIEAGAAETLKERVAEAVRNVLERLVENYGDEQRQKIRASLWPDPSRVEEGIRGDLKELAGQKHREVEDIEEKDRIEAKFIDVISQTMLRNMEKFETLFVLGEDVHRLRGGTAGATRGIAERFPDRLVGTPISENGFTGLALGAALNGMRPVVEIMYPDFALVAADQLFNQVSKVRHMFGGDFAVPVVVRSRVSQGTGYGSQHSMDASGLFALYPGWRIVAPSTPHDYIGLMNAAVACDDPVLVVEYSDLFQERGMIHATDWDYVVPFGKARIARPGNSCTILTYGPMVSTCCAVSERGGFDAEVIDLRTIDPLGVDWETIAESVRRTNALMIVERTTRGTSIGSRMVSDAQSRLFDWLDHEIIHVSGTESSAVVSKVLEEAAFAGAEAVEEALKQLVRRQQMAA